MVPHGLVLPAKSEDLILNAPEKGMLTLEKDKGGKEVYMFSPFEIFVSEPREFTEIFKEFCMASFLTTPQVINAL